MGSVLEYPAGELFLGFQPVRYRALADAGVVGPVARIEYTKIVTVEHNVKVTFIGEVVGEDLNIVNNAVTSLFR